MPCTDGSSYACAGTASSRVTATNRIFVKIDGPFAANYDSISSTSQLNLENLLRHTACIGVLYRQRCTLTL